MSVPTPRHQEAANDAGDITMDTDMGQILPAIASALSAANEWRGEAWYEPVDLELQIQVAGDATAPTLTGWRAKLGEVEVCGAASARIALEELGAVFIHWTTSGAGR